MKNFYRASTIALLASTFLAATAAHAAEEEAAPQKAQAEEIVVTGTRGTGQIAANSAAPVTLLNTNALAKVGQPNLSQALTQLVPSFQAQTQGVDMASFSLSARLRGLSPNHTLVMINGKRRHGSSILQVIPGPFGGSAAPSIDLIPNEAVKRIEVYQEGAAAVYGTDAIAGVINIILKDNNSGGTGTVMAGQNYSGQGKTFSTSGNFGFGLGDSGYVSVTGFHRFTDYTYNGTDQISVRSVNGVVNTSVPSAFQSIYAGLNLSNINGGQPKSYLTVGMINAGYDFGDVEFYAFGDYARRVGYAKQGYRPPNRVCAVSTSPASCFAGTGYTGFVPLQKVSQTEWAFTGGLKGELAGWNWDMSLGYGTDRNDIWTVDSVNRAYYLDTYAASGTGVSPRNFYDGYFTMSLLHGTLDLKHDFDVGFAEPLTLAVGGEFRRETYGIGQGDYFSTYKEGGQSFPGYSKSDAGNYSRNSKAVYLNVIAKPVKDWTIDLAGRYEKFSDFGATTIGKLTTRYDFSPAFALRGTASTGFRAPTMAESYYSSTNVSPTSATVQLPPNSAAAAALGFSPLKAEKSLNLSAGAVFRPTPKLVLSLDGYYIGIKDRIALTSTIYGIRSGVQTTDYNRVMAAIAARNVSIDPTVTSVGVATFTNGVDTRTAGMDFAARYPVDLGSGKLDITFNANYNDTKVTKNKLGSSLFTAVAESYITTAQPKLRAILGLTYTQGKFSGTIRQSYQSRTMVLVEDYRGVRTEGVVKATPLTDLDISYELTSFATLSVGASNLFDKKPEIPAIVYQSVAAGTSPYANNTSTINARYGHGTYGTAGGFYYARLGLKF